MTIIDYLILAVLLAAALYASGRLFLGWLRTPSHEIESETSNIPNLSTAEPQARQRSLAKAGAAEMADMPGQIR